MRRSRFGVILRAVRENEERMRFSGFDTYLPRLAAFVFVNAIAGVCGLLHVLNAGFVSPESLGLAVSTNALVAALIGGVAGSTGPIAGGVLFAFAQDQFGARGFTQLLTGVAIVVFIVLLPRGVIGGLIAGKGAGARGAADMLEVDNLTVSYGRVRALDGVDLAIQGAGALHGIIGPNGAGKSTLLDAMTGRRRPSGGAVRYRGQDITRKSVAWRRRRGMARSFQRTSIFVNLTVREQLTLVAHHLGDDRLGDVIEAMDLGDCLDDPAGRIAYGVQRRVDVALALIGRPQLLLLDEPGAGLSAEETLRLFLHLRDLVRGRGIAAAVVEHDVDAVFACCDVVTVLDLGRHLATGAPAEIRADARVIAAYLGSAA